MCVNSRTEAEGSINFLISYRNLIKKSRDI